MCHCLNTYVLFYMKVSPVLTQGAANLLSAQRTQQMLSFPPFEEAEGDFLEIVGLVQRSRFILVRGSDMKGMYYKVLLKGVGLQQQRSIWSRMQLLVLEFALVVLLHLSWYTQLDVRRITLTSVRMIALIPNGHCTTWSQGCSSACSAVNLR